MVNASRNPVEMIAVSMGIEKIFITKIRSGGEPPSGSIIKAPES